MQHCLQACFFSFLSRKRVQEEDSCLPYVVYPVFLLNEIFSFLFFSFRLITNLHVQYYATGRYTWLFFVGNKVYNR